MKDVVYGWLKAGANLREGALLFSQVAPGNPMVKLLHRDSKIIALVLRINLCRRASLDPKQKFEKEKPPVHESAPLREDWPFLSDLKCPPELKILAANKITCYHTYVKSHELLFDCVTRDQQFATVKTLVESFIENREIIKEFQFFKEHGRVLGKHLVFGEIKKVRALRKMKVLDLVKLKAKLEHNIWRIQSEIRKKDKPHLDIERQKSIQQKEIQLAEIERILEDY